MKYQCRCGCKTDNIKSYFNKQENIRITVCDKCADNYGMKDEKVYDVFEYENLTSLQNNKPKPDA